MGRLVYQLIENSIYIDWAEQGGEVKGQGILLLAPWEEFFLSTTKDLPIAKAPVPSVDPDTKKKVLLGYTMETILYFLMLWQVYCSLVNQFVAIPTFCC